MPKNKRQLNSEDEEKEVSKKQRTSDSEEQTNDENEQEVNSDSDSDIELTEYVLFIQSKLTLSSAERKLYEKLLKKLSTRSTSAQQELITSDIVERGKDLVDEKFKAFEWMSKKDVSGTN
jgi:hypothetical protein